MGVVVALLPPVPRRLVVWVLMAAAKARRHESWKKMAKNVFIVVFVPSEIL